MTKTAGGVTTLGLGLLATAFILGAAAAAPPTSVTLPGDRVFPESVSAASDGTLYVGSFNGGVMKVQPGADKADPFVPPGAAGTRSVLGVLADEKSGTLWLCSNDVSALGVKGPSDVKGSFLKGFDLKTAQPKLSAQLPGDRAFCNDIAIGADGAAYISDSAQPRVLRLPSGSEKLETFVTDPQFAPPADGKGAGLDGIAFGKDGALYVNKFTESALFKVAIEGGKAGTVTKLTTSQPLVLADALRPTEGGAAFLMIEGQGKLDRVTVSGDKAQIDTLKDGFNGPTGVGQVGNTAWVSEGQLPALFGKKTPKLPFSLRAVPIPTP